MKIPEEIQIRVWVPKKEESFLQSLLESYEGLIMILGTERMGEEIEMLLSSSECFREELFDILNDLLNRFPLQFFEVEVK